MRTRREVLAILLLLFALVTLAALSWREGGDTSATLRSSYRTRPDGYKALYLTLRELGCSVSRQQRPFSLLPAHGVLIVADPSQQDISPYERRQLLRWIRRGNSALILIEHAESRAHTLAPTGQADALADDANTVQTIVHGEGQLTTTAPTLTIKSNYRFAEPIVLPADIARSAPQPKVVYADARGAVAVDASIGNGHLIWCSSPWSFSNEGIGQGTNIDFLLAIIARQPGARILFDEYHHGYGPNMTVWDVLPTPAKIGVTHIAVAILVLFITLAWRFGVPRLPADERFTRSRAEYLTSMAALMQRGRASRAVHAHLVMLLHRQVGRRLGLPPQASLEQLVAANAGQPVVDHAALQRVVQQLIVLAPHKHPNEDTLLGLARDIHHMIHRGRSGNTR